MKIVRIAGIIILGIWLFIHCVAWLLHGQVALLESFLSPAFLLPFIGLIVLLRWECKNHSRKKPEQKSVKLKRETLPERAQSKLTKKCPYCGQILDSVVFRCTRCNKWVANEVFNGLCEDDVKLIKDKDLTPLTPNEMADVVITIVGKTISKEAAETFSERQQFNILAFNSFCFFKSICAFIRMKQGCRHTITEAFEIILLQRVAELFRERGKHSPPLEVLTAQAKVLYAKFKIYSGGARRSISSQQKSAIALAPIVLPPDDGGANFTKEQGGTYISLFTCFNHMCKPGEGFSRMFLVEDEDFDWQAALGRQKMNTNSGELD